MQDICAHQDSALSYKNDIEYLKDELQRLDLMLDLMVRRARSRSDDPLRGMYVSDEEAASLLAKDKIDIVKEEALYGSRNAREALAAIETRLHGSREAGFEPSLQRMARDLVLSREEIDIIIFSASVELDPKYAKIFGYLHDDLSRWRPSPGLIIESLSAPEARMEMRRLFLPGSALIRYGILATSDGARLSLSSGLVMSPDVLELITGEREQDGREIPGASAKGVFMQTALPEEVIRKAEILAEKHLQAGMAMGWICVIQGERGSGRRALADFICTVLGRRTVVIDIEALDDEEALSEIRNGFSRAAIRSAPIIIEGYDASGHDEGQKRARAALQKALENFCGPAILCAKGSVDLKGPLRARSHFIEIPPADYAARRRIWQEIIGSGIDSKSRESLASEMAARFRLTPGRIMDAYVSARKMAELDGRARPNEDDIFIACRMESSRILSGLARRIEPQRRLEEVVLPPERMEQLREIKNYIRNRGRVYVDWGFEKKLSLGRGLNVLFSGSSGTGKTMAAEALAREIGLDLYKIDLSSVVSKYIGETEKNLRKIFDEAEESNAILFFDEADALFGKRSDVKDAHDRYANVEISYLLQKMEEHEGIVILATNLSRNMDEAFLRRMHFVVEFPFPEEDCRLLIWRSLLPEEAPVDGDLDLDFLAGKLALAGGSIKNILVAAAFLAAEDSGVICMKHLVRAAWKEMRKIGKVCSPVDFGDYYKLIDAD